MSRDLRAENEELRRELRTAELSVGALTYMVAQQQTKTQDLGQRLLALAQSKGDLRRAMMDFKFRDEAPVARVLGMSSAATMAIYRFLGNDPATDVSTLQDLAYAARADIAALKGVGPKAISKLDAAMAEHGLTWAVEEVS